MVAILIALGIGVIIGFGGCFYAVRKGYLRVKSS